MSPSYSATGKYDEAKRARKMKRVEKAPAIKRQFQQSYSPRSS
ncbi:unnamed protein product [Linum tenue]|uniref:Uncharacterized protein n=1 Tax=Linum tenue TaxID=586396 RepID=A0AAV0NWW9_9ROSI|nr:unnamed protein product [Linum tenue]